MHLPKFISSFTPLNTFPQSMTPLLPVRSVTMVLPFPARNVVHAIHERTHPTGVMVPPHAMPLQGYWFRGEVVQNQFWLSPKVEHFHSYMPVVSGRVERTPHGSIVFMEYRLFRSTQFFMVAWSLVTLFCVLLFTFGVPRTNLALMSATLLITNYLVAFASFTQHVKRTQALFNQLFEEL